MSHDNYHNPLYLLKQRRFLPFFNAQFLGAFNDNLYKNALILLFAIQAKDGALTNADTLINLCAGLLILPFFFFSALAGQLADKYDKARLIRHIKLAEVVIAIFGAVAFHSGQAPLLIFILFLLGTQSAFFSPIKYSYLPDHLYHRELLGGNGLLEMGTFVSILLGTISGTLLISLHSPHTATWVSLSVITVAVLGYLSSRAIPYSPPSDPHLKIAFNPITETWKIIKASYNNKSVFISILGVSWFWYFGAIILAQIPQYSLIFLGGSEEVVTIMLVLFSLSIGVGSILCARLSKGRIEVGVVPLGALGLTLFSLDFSLSHMTPELNNIDWITFLTTPYNWRLLTDLFMMGLFSGFYLVPLYTIMQKNTSANMRSRIIAANSIFNSIFMVAASAVAILTLSYLNISIPTLFTVTALMNGAVSLYLFYWSPEFWMRFLAWSLIHTIYQVEQDNLHHIPKTGPAVLVCNHVSYADAIILIALSKRPIRFVMHHSFANIPILGFILRTAKAIPFASESENPEINQRADEAIEQALKQDELVCLFPEGKISRDGHINPFKPGLMKILEKNPVPVVPIALKGLWGSFFSYKYGKAMRHWPRHIFNNRIGVVAAKPMAAADVNLSTLRAHILQMRGQWR